MNVHLEHIGAAGGDGRICKSEHDEDGRFKAWGLCSCDRTCQQRWKFESCPHCSGKARIEIKQTWMDKPGEAISDMKTIIPHRSVAENVNQTVHLFLLSSQAGQKASKNSLETVHVVMESRMTWGNAVMDTESSHKNIVDKTCLFICL